MSDSIIGSLYELRPSDLSGPVWEPLKNQINNSAAATQVKAISSSPPVDKLWVITSLAGLATPGAGQNVDTFIIEVQTIDGQEVRLGYPATDMPGAADERLAINWTGLLVLRPTETIESLANFNAGVQTNFATLGIVGYQIPKGNVG